MSRIRNELDLAPPLPMPRRTARLGRPSGRSTAPALLVFLGLALSSVALSSPGCRAPALEERLAALERAADRQAVVELVYLYAYGLDRGDAALLERIFLPDAVAEYVGADSPLDVRLEGVRAILDWLRATDRGRSAPGHYMATPVVEVDGDRARLYAYQHNRDVSGAGLYTIDAVRTSEGWRIAKLHLDQHDLASAKHDEREEGVAR